MENLKLLTANSVLFASQSSETVPTVVQSSSGGLRLIGFVLVVLMVILTILTVTLILIELRQNTLCDMVHAMARRLERMEKQMRADAEEASAGETGYISGEKDRVPVSDEAAKNLSAKPPSVPDITDAPGTVGSKNGDTPSGQNTGNAAVPQKVTSAPTLSVHPVLTQPKTSANTADDRSLPTEHKEPEPVTGLKVSVTSHYNKGQISLEEIAPDDATLILLSDMTVSPIPKLFRAYNNPAFFTNHDFTLIYDFQDREGYLIDMAHSIKLLEMAKAAVVKKTQDGYLLERKGIMIVEEQ